MRKIWDLFLCHLYFVLFCSLFSCELDQHPLILQSIGVNSIAPNLGFFLSALLCLIFSPSFYMRFMTAISYCNLSAYIVMRRIEDILSCQLYFVLFRSPFLCVLDQHPLIFQSIGVICNVPDLVFFSCQLYFILFRSLFLCELDQRPPILHSLGVNSNAPALRFFSCQLYFALFSLTLFMRA